MDGQRNCNIFLFVVVHVGFIVDWAMVKLIDWKVLLCHLAIEWTPWQAALRVMMMWWKKIKMLNFCLWYAMYAGCKCRTNPSCKQKAHLNSVMKCSRSQGNWRNCIEKRAEKEEPLEVCMFFQRQLWSLDKVSAVIKVACQDM